MNRDPTAERLIDEFFDTGHALREEDAARRQTRRELAPPTVLLIRAWSAGRALAAFTSAGSPAERSRLIAEHSRLEGWLEERSP
ncbi:hypothetical protein [Streptomyces monashensis]|uniref:Uncharacterized protein n=1 Tax=Streptomyces monashensis TaxID=1678012 RepID=A0A1S2PY44_9ACTN|nr:hypothetical protein [Streptomyces monashensis]OIJ98502.1 hypothetical protein BIV23_29540 [Streptomyces monashensis]